MKASTFFVLALFVFGVSAGAWADYLKSHPDAAKAYNEAQRADEDGIGGNYRPAVRDTGKALEGIAQTMNVVSPQSGDRMMATFEHLKGTKGRQ